MQPPLTRFNSPTWAGHAYAAAISACAAGGVWPRAVQLFDEMLELGIRPDVVSCTALIAALGSDAQWERAERVLAWMLQVGLRRLMPAGCFRPRIGLKSAGRVSQPGRSE